MRFHPIVLIVVTIGVAALLAMPAADAKARKQRKAAIPAKQVVPSGGYPPVFVHGKYVGTDPDPRVRSFMQRDTGSAYPGPD